MADKIFYLIVAGSRSFVPEEYSRYGTESLENIEILAKCVDRVSGELVRQGYKIVIVHGGAKGADTCADLLAHFRNYDCRVFEADWKTHGKSAGHKRNEDMHKWVSEQSGDVKKGTLLIWDGESVGTRSNFGYSKLYDIPCRCFRYDKGKFMSIHEVEGLRKEVLEEVMKYKRRRV